MTEKSVPEQTELFRRHRSTAVVVAVFLLLDLLLVTVAYAATEMIFHPGDPVLAEALWIAILIFGFGAVVLRRNRFAAMRLQDVAALGGIQALLSTLEHTTVQVASLGGAIALMGFMVTVLTGHREFMAYAGLVAAAVLIYAYPRRTAWQRVVEGIELFGDANDPIPSPKER